MSALPAAAEPRSLGASALRRFDQRSLPAQIALTGAAASFAAATVLALGFGPRVWQVPFAVAAAGLASALIGAALALRSTRGLREVAAAARLIARDDTLQDHHIPLVACSAEMRRATANLRRMLEAARRRQDSLVQQNTALSSRLALRTHELSTLQDLSIGLATKSDLHELVDEALGALGQAMDYSSASLWARAERAAGGHVVLLGYRLGEDGEGQDAEDLTGMRLSRSNLQRYEQMEREREPLIENHARQSLLSWLWSKVTDDARSSELYRASRSWMAVPLRFRDDVLGVMRVDHEATDFFDPERARLLMAVSSQTALAMRHAQLQSRQREVAVMAERNRIARDLHDAVSQTLFAAEVLAGTLAQTSAREPPPTPASVHAQALTLERLNRAAVAEMRLLMFELRPDAMLAASVAELLQLAIEALAGRGPLVVVPNLSRDGSPLAEVRLQVYRIAQEALANVARHSDAQHCTVDWVMRPDGTATLQIVDDGKGFDVEAEHPGHFGLENMRSRAAEIGARLTLRSTPGQGTDLRVDIVKEA